MASGDLDEKHEVCTQLISGGSTQFESWRGDVVPTGPEVAGGSATFGRSARNAAYSLGDYVAQPAIMLAAAPFLVHHLGFEQYGLWMLASAILSGADRKSVV